ncbi:MAG: SHOCT domain-containing protein [Clostridiales bacterium]|nr:SHOCT domain-containing protein [Clostridiales bacterium]
MFKRNDKALLTSRIIIMVTIGIIAVLSLVAGILLAVDNESGVYILVTFAGWFLCWIMWVFARLYLSYLVDIKLIRNKLYGENKDVLDVFLKAKEERSNSPVMQENKQMVNAEIEHLQQLLHSGVITLEEYENRKEELTKGN